MDPDQKTIQLLKACRAEELPGLRRFAASPYHNRRAVPEKLLDLLLESWPDFTGPLPAKERLYANLYPGEAFDDKNWRYLLSNLNALIEEYWTDLADRNDEAGHINRRLATLAGRGVEKAYRHAQRQAEQWLEKTPHRDAAWFLFAHQHHDIQHQYFSRKGLRKNDEALQLASDFLDKYYFLGKLRYACAMLARQQVLQGDFSPGISPGWLQHLETQDYFGEPLIRLYHHALLAQLDEQDPERYRALRSSLSDPALQIPPDDELAVFRIAINYCARKIRQGEEEYASEALDLYSQGIRSGVLLEQGQLSPWTFNNVVKLALRQKQFEWLEQFMEENSHLLPDEHRGNALHYNLAELYFYTNRLRQAQLQLLQVEMSDLNYSLGARVLLAKIYKETGEEEALLSLLAAFTVFLKRNRQISAELKHTYLNFCRLLWQMMRAKPKQRHRLLEDIQQTQPLTDRSWLLAQLEG